MRAVLFANATATTRLGRRRRSPITHGSALVAFERSRLALAPLISNRRKYWLPRLDMSRHQTQPRCKFATAAKAARLRDHRRYSGSDNGTDARYRRQALADRIALMPGHQLFLEHSHRCFDLLDLRGEYLQHLARKTRETSVL